MSFLVDSGLYEIILSEEDIEFRSIIYRAPNSDVTTITEHGKGLSFSYCFIPRKSKEIWATPDRLYLWEEQKEDEEIV